MTMILKPQDIVILLKLVTLGSRPWGAKKDRKWQVYMHTTIDPDLRSMGHTILYYEALLELTYGN